MAQYNLYHSQWKKVRNKITRDDSDGVTPANMLPVEVKPAHAYGTYLGRTGRAGSFSLQALQVYRFVFYSLLF